MNQKVQSEISSEERKTLQWRFNRIKNISQGWENAEDFIRWCLRNGYRKGRQMRRAFPSRPHGPGNSYFYDPNERTGVCTGCKQKCPEDGHGCAVWRERWIKNWDGNICIRPKTAQEPEVPHQREKFRYEAPDLIREGLTFG